MKKRKIAISLCILCLLLCTAAQAAEKPLIKGSSSLRYAVSDTLVWVIAENGRISCYDQGMIKTDVTALDGVACLTAKDQSLYCLTSDGAQQKIYLLTSSTSAPNGRLLEAGCRMVQLEVIGRLYLLGDDGCVYWASAVGTHGPYITEKLSVEGWENAQITAIAAYGEYLCAYSAPTGKLSVISYNSEGTGRLVYPTVRADGLQCMQIGQTINGALHLYALREVQKEDGLLDINLQTGDMQPATLSLPAGSTELRRNLDTLYALSSDSTALYAVSLAGQAGMKASTLTLLNTFIHLSEPASYEKAAFEGFYARYPNVQLTSRWENDIRVIATGIMAGSEGYDVTTIQENSTYISSIDMYKAGASVNLEEIPEIAQLLSQCADVFAPVSAEGHLIGIPDFFSPYLWSINDALCEKIGLDIPRDGWTWEDFFALGEQVRQYNASHAEKVYLLQDNTGTLPYFLVQYNANTVDVLSGTAHYDDANFISALTLWTQLCQDGLVLFREQDTSASALLYATDNTAYTAAVAGEYGPLLLPPVFDAQTRYPLDVFRTVINVNSPCLEEAEYLFSCLLTENKLQSGTFCSNNGYLLKSDMEKDLANDPTGNKRIWYTMLQNAVQDYYIGDLYKDQWQYLYPQLLAGTLSPTEYAQTCQMRADMVLSE